MNTVRVEGGRIAAARDLAGVRRRTLEPGSSRPTSGASRSSTSACSTCWPTSTTCRATTRRPARVFQRTLDHLADADAVEPPADRAT